MPSLHLNILFCNLVHMCVYKGCIMQKNRVCSCAKELNRVNAHKTDKKKKKKKTRERIRVKYREKISSMETEERERETRTRLHNKRKKNEDFPPRRFH